MEIIFLVIWINPRMDAGKINKEYYHVNYLKVMAYLIAGIFPAYNSPVIYTGLKWNTNTCRHLFSRHTISRFFTKKNESKDIMKQVKQAFDLIAQEYDKHREHIIPDFHQFYGSAVWAADSPVTNPHILDIGAGTGLLSAFLLQKYPDASITLIDFAENMLDVARKRFADKKNFRYIVGDYCTADYDDPYDLVCSALSIHHLASEDKQGLFRKIFSALNPGGLFVNADQAEGETKYFTDRYMQYWNEYLLSGPFHEAEHLEILKRRCELDRNEPLSVQLQWLKDAGFSDVDVIYRNRTFIVTVARKSE